MGAARDGSTAERWGGTLAPARRRAAVTDGAGPSGRGGDSVGLPERLRAETHAAHLAAETAFDLARRVASPAAYVELLLVFDGFLRDSAATLALAAPALPDPLRDGPARRRARVAADLRTLGRPPTVPLGSGGPGRSPADAGDPILRDRALGAWYVHEGSALGGLVICAEVRRRRPEARDATTFFGGEVRHTAARWRSFRSALAAWPGDAAAVCAGALDSFAELTGRLERSR